MKRSLPLMCAVLAVAGCMLFSCKGGSQGNAAAALQVKYETKVLQTESRVYHLTFPATLSGDTEISIYPQVEGIIKVCNCSSGIKVKKGQTLFVIDPTEFRLSVQSAQANLSAAQAQMETTRLQYESNRTLAEKKIISDYVLQTSLNAYEVAKAAVSQAEAQLNIAKTNLGYCTVTSPITGFVADKEVEEGDLAYRGVALCTVSDNSVVKAKFSLTETQLLGMVREYGLRVTEKGLEGPKGRQIGDVFPPLKLLLKDGSTYEHDGMLDKIDAIVNASTGTVTCKAAFPNPDGILRSGLSAKVVIPLEGNVLCAPQTAAVRLQDQMMFYRVKEDGTVEGVICQVFPSNDGTEYYIIDGLNPGDEIVTNGVRKLSNGVSVR